MSLRSLFIILLVSVSIVACNTDGKKNSSEDIQKFVAQVDSTMTLLEIAKANNIGEPYLRSELNIPKRIGSKQTIAMMAKRFDFTLDDVRRVIEDRKNDQARRQLKRNKAKE